VAQSSGRFRLAFEALEKLGFPRQFGHDDLERHGPHGAQVGRLKNGAHGASAQLLVDFVFAIEDGAWQGL
jgi:hypothetical protein